MGKIRRKEESGKMRKTEGLSGGGRQINRNKPMKRLGDTSKSSFHKAQRINQQEQATKAKKQKELEEANKRKEVALQKYNKKKRQNYKKIAKVNYKGQPNLSAQVELLLEKINCNKT